MKRNKKTEKFKAYLRKEDELWKNRRAQANLGYKELDKPIHRGYDGTWTLRKDIARRVDAIDYFGLIHYYGQTVWCKDESFTRWSHKLKKEVDIKPYFKKITESEYNTLRPWIKRFFSYSLADDKVRWNGEVIRHYRVNVPEYFFVLEKNKHYKTHYKVIDEVLLQEEAEIYAALDTTFYKEQRRDWNRHYSQKDDRTLDHRARRTYNKRILKKNISYLQDLDDYEDVFEYKYNHRHSGKWDWW